MISEYLIRRCETTCGVVFLNNNFLHSRTSETVQFADGDTAVTSDPELSAPAGDRTDIHVIIEPGGRALKDELED